MKTITESAVVNCTTIMRKWESNTMTMQEEEKPTENKLINEPYERIDRLNYKDRADRNVDHGDELYTERREWSNQAQRAVSTQQEAGIQDIRSQRDVLFAAMMSERQQLFGNLMTLTTEVNANHVDLARRTSADAQTLSIKQLDKDTTDVTSEGIGAKVSQDLVPEINNAVKAAVAVNAGSVSTAQGLGDLNAANINSMASMLAQMQAAAQAMQQAAVSIQALAAK